MRPLFLGLVCALAVSAGTFTPVDPADQIETMTRGVNIIGYDPLWRDFSKARFQERHFRLIHEAGFQTVRIVLQAMSHMDADNRLAPEWLKTLDWAVENATANGLTAILDEHDFNVCGQNAEGCKPKLMAFWEQVAAHFKDAPSSVLFEILNEPNTQVTPEVWNAWVKEALGISARATRDATSSSVRRRGTTSASSTAWNCRRTTGISS